MELGSEQIGKIRRGVESPELNQNICKNLALDKNEILKKNQEIRSVYSTAGVRKSGKDLEWNISNFILK